MTKITSTGEGLSVLIACDYVPHHHWMAFATWYSVSKNLPDAKVGILCNRRPLPVQMYGWARTLKLNMRYHQPLTKEQQVRAALFSGNNCSESTFPFLTAPLLVLEPEVVMVREMDDFSCFEKPFLQSDRVWVVNDPDATPEKSDLCLSVKDEHTATFVAYPDGWGNFVTSSWINKVRSPFQHRFGKAGMTSNEVRVEKLWKQLSHLYQTVSRG